MKTIFAAFFVLTACGHAVVAPTVPEAIKAPADQKASLEFFAKGTQNYTCTQSATDQTYSWVFTAPEATLYDGTDDKAPVAGSHSAGPTWQTKDGAKFVGDSPNAKKADSPDAASIPWLLIPKKSTDGSGQITTMNFAQRVNTSGGKAPTTGCDASTVNTVQKIDYTANYFFYGPK